MTTTNFKALPLLASMLGDKLGVKVVIGSRQTACTDGGTIYLPSLPINAPEQLIGLINGYLDHEAAHIRYTDFDQLHQAGMSALEYHVCNIFEDWRVEKTIVGRYPGCYEHFVWLIRYLFININEIEEKAGEDISPAFSILNFALLVVRSWTVSEIHQLSEKEARVISNHWPGLADKLNELLSQVKENCQSTFDSINFAKKFVGIIKQYIQNIGKHQTNRKEKKLQKRSSVLPYSGTSEDNFESQKNSLDKEVKSDLDEKKQLLKSLIKIKKRDLPVGFDNRIAQAIGDNTHNTAQEAGVATEAYIDTSPLPAPLISDALATSLAMRTRLQAHLQSRVLKRICPSRHGKMSGQLLHRVSVLDSRLFRKNVEVGGVNTAIHLLLDISGSMANRISLATSACYSVAYALSAIAGISIAISVFPADHSTDQPTVCSLVGHGERLSTKLSVQTGGSTPLTEALWWVAKKLVPRFEHRKLVLVITDGSPNDFMTASETIQALEKMGIEVMGVGIKVSILHQLFSNFETISTIQELAPAMFTMLQRTLFTKRG